MDSKNRWEQERLEAKKQRREEIIQAATKIFTEKGFEKATMQHIADELMMGVATVFRYFPKKEELIIAVTIDVLNQYVETFKDIAESKQSGYEKIVAIFDYFMTHLDADKQHAAQLLETFESLMITYHETIPGNESLMDTRKSISLLLFQIIDEGKADGSIRQDIPIELTVATYINVFGLFSRKLSLFENIPILTHDVDNLAQLQLLKTLFLKELKA